MGDVLMIEGFSMPTNVEDSMAGVSHQLLKGTARLRMKENADDFSEIMLALTYSLTAIDFLVGRIKELEAKVHVPQDTNC